MIGKAISALQSSMTKLDELAEECADYENIPDLLRTVREHGKLADQVDNLQRHIGEREMASCLFFHARIPKLNLHVRFYCFVQPQ